MVLIDSPRDADPKRCSLRLFRHIVELFGEEEAGTKFKNLSICAIRRSLRTLLTRENGSVPESLE